MTELPELRAALSEAAQRRYGRQRPWRQYASPLVRFSAAAGAIAIAVVVISLVADALRGNEQAKAMPLAASAPVVGCKQAGSGPIRPEMRAAGITAGPVLFAYAQELSKHSEIVGPDAEELRELIENPAASDEARARARETITRLAEDGYGLATIMIFVESGTTATVALPVEERNRASLIYTDEAKEKEIRGAAGVFRVEDGDLAVTFQACEDGPAHFNGGLIVTGQPRCLPVVVSTGRGDGPLVRYLPIATGERSCPER